MSAGVNTCVLYWRSPEVRCVALVRHAVTAPAELQGIA